MRLALAYLDTKHPLVSWIKDSVRWSAIAHLRSCVKNIVIKAWLRLALAYSDTKHLLVSIVSMHAWFLNNGQWQMKRSCPLEEPCSAIKHGVKHTFDTLFFFKLFPYLWFTSAQKLSIISVQCIRCTYLPSINFLGGARGCWRWVSRHPRSHWIYAWFAKKLSTTISPALWLLSFLCSS